MNSSLFRLILAGALLLGAYSIRNAEAQDTFENARFITVIKDKDRDRDIERYRIDLGAIDSGQIVELVAARDKSFKIVTEMTNLVTGKFDELTNINFVDLSTNFVGKIAIPKNSRDQPFLTAPAPTNTNVNPTTR